MLNETDLSRTDLNLLVLFETVLAEQHVGRAAMRLNLSPSAISHGLGRLRRLLNDPLFLRTPKGVVPTARALELAMPVAEILSRIRSVVATATPFDPARSTRRFMIGAPDAVSAVFLPALLAELRRHAPGIDIGIRQLLPMPGAQTPQRAWAGMLDDLETRGVDIAIAPVDEVPARFAAEALYEEDFVIAMRRGHPFASKPTLEHYCRMQHLVVSLSGDPDGFIDRVLARQGRARRVALTVSSFAQAMVVLGDTDLIAALPRRLVALQAARFGLASAEPPIALEKDMIRAIATRAALMDAGTAWLFGLVRSLFTPADRKRSGSRHRRRRSGPA